MFTEAEYLKKPSERTISGPYVENDHVLAVRNGAVRNRYMGRSLPFEPNYLNAMRLILESVRPSVIVEIGAIEGGLTAYMSDILHSFNYDFSIFAFDLAANPSSRPSVYNAYFHSMDTGSIGLDIHEQLVTSGNVAGPMVVVHNVWDDPIAELNSCDKYMKNGDILVTTCVPEYHDPVMEWADGKYEIMARLCDLFGENNIQNPNGFMIKAE